MSIKHIFFDLDRTLWDFEKNSHTTLLQLISYFNLTDKGVDTPESFIKKYKIHNAKLWDLYREDKIKKEELRSKRFLMALAEYGIKDKDLAEQFGLAYIKQSPLQTNLFPFSHEALSYLQNKYTLHIITNGFEEVQHIKLAASDLKQYFDIVVTSEKAGVKKPNAKIFEFALEQANAKAEQSIMIGDDLAVDVLGAEKVGIQGVYFNPHKQEHKEEVVHEIFCLSELMALL
jgi:putative hydrolase of the HAD superfamily